MSIPHKIHYCWFGGRPLPGSAERCMASWEKFFPGYEIVRWDESNFDVSMIPYCAEAYEAKKYAFVSDFARFWILYNYGGVYFDTDVEVIRPMHDIIEAGAFMGCEHDYDPDAPVVDIGVAPGLGIAAEKDNPLFKEIIDYYSGLHFKLPDGSLNTTTIVVHVSEILSKYGLCNSPHIQDVAGFKIYPVEYFCPKSTKDGKLRITNNTRSIHHYDQSWQSPWRKFGRKFVLRIGGHKLKDRVKAVLLKK